MTICSFIIGKLRFLTVYSACIVSHADSKIEKEAVRNSLESLTLISFALYLNSNDIVHLENGEHMYM